MTGRAPALLRALRPHHWLKNGFVVAPALFSGHALDSDAMERVALTAAAFCLASSAGYLVNDVLDRGVDAADPRRRSRPVASGELAVAAALAAALALAAGAGVVAALAQPSVALWLAAYLAISLAYSVALKVVPIVEGMLLAAGFVVRLVAGAAAIPVPSSHWLVTCGFLLALLLAFGKRLADAPAPSPRRPAYPVPFLAGTVGVLAAVTVVAYVLYTVAPETVANVGSRRLLVTTPLVLFGVLRYLLLLHREGAGDPTTALLTDRALLVTVLLWALTSAAIVAGWL